MTEEEIEEYSVAVKSNSAKLLRLINNILDLSRLEAGMMRFNVQECDVVQLCREAGMIVDMETPGIVKSTFNTELEMLQVEVDSKWFLKLLTSLITVPYDYKGEKREVEYTLSQENKNLKIMIQHSPLYQCWEDEQEQHILHNINRLYVETFKGCYQIEKQGEKKQSLSHTRYPEIYFLWIIVSPSRKGRITFSTRVSCATSSLKALIPMVCKSLLRG